MLIKKKSQISVELILIISMFMIIFISFLSVVEKRNDEFFSMPDYFYAKTVCEEFAFAINDVYIAGNNATKVLYFPETLENIKNYSLKTYSGAKLVEIMYDEKRYTFPILTSYIADYNIISGAVKITNIEGEIIVTQ